MQRITEVSKICLNHSRVVTSIVSRPFSAILHRPTIKMHVVAFSYEAVDLNFVYHMLPLVPEWEVKFISNEKIVPVKIVSCMAKKSLERSKTQKDKYKSQK